MFKKAMVVFALLAIFAGNALFSQAARPAWVNSPASRFNPQLYVSAVGVGPNRVFAERAALANLAGQFGLRVEAETRVHNIYWEAASSGAQAEWSDITGIDQTIFTAARVNFLVGAEIRDIWHDGAGTYFVAAVMGRARTTQIYTDLIRANLSMINNLTDMAPAERNSLAGFARYTLAAAAADANESYALVLGALGAPSIPGVRPGDQYRLAATQIAANIPVMVVVQKRDDLDMGGRVHGAFSRAVSEAGLRTVPNGGQYTLEVRMNMPEADFPGQRNVFVRYEISANFVNSATGISQLPAFNINGREGHISLSEAENRAIAAAERRILADYGNLLSENLVRILPRR
ncbi:MAG: LPP20 family lipoprotein [Spirochaetes bacterium]|nr:LPP20 family lipoprotein [Spirochaetota bacterium]